MRDPHPGTAGSHSSARNGSRTQITRARLLTWLVGLLGVVLIGQANEFSFVYIGKERLVSPISFVLSIAAAWYGLCYLRRPGLGLPMGLLIATFLYTLCVGVLVSAPALPLDASLPEVSKLFRALFVLACLFVGLQAVTKAGHIRVLANVFTCSAAVIVAFQVGSYLLGHDPSIRVDVSETGTFRYSGIFGDPNQAAGFAVLLLCVTLFSTFPIPLKLFLAGLSLAGVMVTFSRGGLVTFMAVASANAVIGKPLSRVGFTAAAVLCAGFVFVAIPLIVDSGLLDLQASLHIKQLNELAAGRAELADNSRGLLLMQALAAIETHPVSGHGFLPYGAVLGTGSHNMYTHLALLAGVPAALIYGLAVCSLGVCGLRLRCHAEQRFVVSIAAWMACMGLSLHTLFDEKHSVTFIATSAAITAAACSKRNRAYQRSSNAFIRITHPVLGRSTVASTQKSSGDH